VRRSPIIAFVTMAACLYGLWVLVPDIAFGFRGAPVEVRAGSREGLAAGAHVRWTGPAEDLGWTATLSGERRAVALTSDRVILLLPPVEGRKGAFDADVTGRVHRGDRARGWGAAAEAVAARHGGRPADFFVIVDGVHPSFPWGAGGLALLLAGVFALNVGWLKQRYARRADAVAEPGAPG
jgi:hypothetical protein